MGATTAIGAVRRSITGHTRFRNVQRFRGGLVCKAHRLVYHSTLGLRLIKKKKKKKIGVAAANPFRRTTLQNLDRCGAQRYKWTATNAPGLGLSVWGSGFRV